MKTLAGRDISLRAVWGRRSYDRLAAVCLAMAVLFILACLTRIWLLIAAALIGLILPSAYLAANLRDVFMEWLMLRKGVPCDAEITGVSDADTELYNIRYRDAAGRLHESTASIDRDIAAASGKTVKIMLDPDNPEKFIVMTGNHDDLL